MARKANQFDSRELYRTIRTNLEFMQIQKKLKAINLTSTTKNEGKSTISVELAKSYALKYDNVLLIDSDLRNPSIHRILGLSNVNGLTNALATFVDNPEQAFGKTVQVMELEAERKLSVLTAGTKVINSTEILASDVFKAFMEKAKEEYDFVIVDCAPAGIVADAIPVSNVCDGTLFVISSEENQKKSIKSCAENLKRNGANVLGIILNKVDVKNKEYGYGRNYGYQYE